VFWLADCNFAARRDETFADGGILGSPVLHTRRCALLVSRVVRLPAGQTNVVCFWYLSRWRVVAASRAAKRADRHLASSLVGSRPSRVDAAAPATAVLVKDIA